MDEAVPVQLVSLGYVIGSETDHKQLLSPAHTQLVTDVTSVHLQFTP